MIKVPNVAKQQHTKRNEIKAKKINTYKAKP